MHYGHKENWADQIKKKLVVLLPNAVVDVLAVVVEVVNAAIAGATVFRWREHVCVTNLAAKFKIFALKSLAIYEVRRSYFIDCVNLCS